MEKKNIFLMKLKQIILLLGMMWKISPLNTIILFVLTIITGVLMPVSLLISRRFINALTDLLNSGQWNFTPFFWVFMMIGISIFYKIFNDLLDYSKENFSDEFRVYILDLVLSKVSKLSQAEYDNSELYNKIKITIEEIPERSFTLIETICSLSKLFIQVICTSAIIILLHWMLLLIPIIIAIPIFIIHCRINKNWYNNYQECIEKLRFSDTLRDIILKNENIKELKLYNVFGFIIKKIKSIQESYIHNRKKYSKQVIRSNILEEILQQAYSAISKILIVLMALKFKFDLGTVIMYINATDDLKSLINASFNRFSTIYNQMLYLDNVFLIINLQEEDVKENVDCPQKISKIKFENVYFKYPAGSSYVLKDFSYTFEIGKNYAIVGINGAGKTTLIKLLLKLYEPSKGCITINNIDIKQIKGESLRRHISAVFQDFIRYPFTISDNIGMSNINEINKERIFEAAQKANVYEDIIGTKDGFDTQLFLEWENGTELSGGQWQKVAIARGNYRQSDLLILDEPFSSIDAYSEKMVINELKKKKHDKINILITHKYTNLAYLDRILVIKDGKIIEQGTPEKLMAIQGEYFKLYNVLAE